MKQSLTRLMKSVLRLHPMLADEELRLAYEACEYALGYKPKKGKCLMRNSGITLDMTKGAFIDELAKADAKYYFDTALDWSDSTGAMRIDWIATVRGFARRDLRDGKLKVSKFKSETVSNAGGGFTPEPISKTAMTYEEYKRLSKTGK